MSQSLATGVGVYTSDPWTVYANDFNVSAISFNQSLVYDPIHPNQDVNINWTASPRQPSDVEIRAFPSIGFGSGPWGAPTPLSGLTESINAHTSLTLKYDLTASGDKTGYDVSFDIWLSSSPNGGAAAVTTEVMVWLHTGGFSPIGSNVGAYSDSSFSGSIFSQPNISNASLPHPWNYIAFDSSSDNLSGQIDVLAMLKKAESLGLITGDEYVSGIQLGAEVAWGTGGLDINSLEVSEDGSGNYVKFDQRQYMGSAGADDIYLYGHVVAPSLATTRDATYSTTVSITANGTIMAGAAPEVAVFINGVEVGTAQLAATPGTYVDSAGVTWTTNQSFAFSVPGLTNISELKLVFVGSSNVGGAEASMVNLLNATVDGVPLSTTEYHAAGGATAQQQIGSNAVQWGGGYTLVDATAWNTYQAANHTGMSTSAITVIGGGGTDTIHVLGTASQYSIVPLSNGDYQLSEHSGLDQNAILRGISHITFQDGTTLDPASWAAEQATPALSIAAVTSSLSEGTGAAQAFDFTITRSGDLSQASSISWSVTGAGPHPADAADFVGGALPGGTVNFGAGQASASLTVNVLGDAAAEPDEQFTVNLSNPAHATIGAGAASATILNDDVSVVPPPAPSSSSGASSVQSTPNATPAIGVVVDGTASNDVFTAGPAGDSIRGLDGNDTIGGGAGADLINGNRGADSIFGGQGSDTLYGGQGADTIEGDIGQKLINGNMGNDLIYGGTGNSSLYGGQDDDTIYGGSGDDQISGDLGNDILFGGAGADRFLFRPGSGQDWIADFNGAEGDKIVLPTGTAYTTESYQNQVLIEFGNGDRIGLAGVTQAQFQAHASEWLSYS